VGKKKSREVTNPFTKKKKRPLQGDGKKRRKTRKTKKKRVRHTKGKKGEKKPISLGVNHFHEKESLSISEKREKRKKKEREEFYRSQSQKGSRTQGPRKKGSLLKKKETKELWLLTRESIRKKGWIFSGGGKKKKGVFPPPERDPP